MGDGGRGRGVRNREKISKISITDVGKSDEEIKTGRN